MNYKIIKTTDKKYIGEELTLEHAPFLGESFIYKDLSIIISDIKFSKNYLHISSPLYLITLKVL